MVVKIFFIIRVWVGVCVRVICFCHVPARASQNKDRWDAFIIHIALAGI